ncbi:MAG TPA: NADH-ubiquinone oxidoreductase-F iron-sulfur binding region domain-containing protein [Pseudonocardiaceae bacterium]
MTDLVGAPPSHGPRLFAGWAATGRPADLAAHLNRYGPLPAHVALIDLARSAGLRGRGGAWFPTGTKLAAVAAGKRKGSVVANGVESEPVSDKDHALLTVAPHLVLDGMALAANAVGARDAVLCVPRGDVLVPSLLAAIASRTGDPVPIRLAEVPHRYVASEESALVNFLNTGMARPTERPPLPFERGVRGRPTLVDNVETLADLALLARYGADWFRSVGTAAAPGTALCTVGGAVARPGVREFPVGASLRSALGEFTEPVAAVLVGGFGGIWVGQPADLALAPDLLGVALLLALPARACGLATTARIVRYLAGESAMQCGPCMFGLAAVSQDLDALVSGQPVLDRLRQRLGVVNGRGACAHPDGAVRLAASALSVFADDVRSHAAGRPCFGVRVDPGFPIPAATGLGVGWR